MVLSVASIVFDPLERRQEEVKQVETKSSWRYPVYQSTLRLTSKTPAPAGEGRSIKPLTIGTGKNSHYGT